MIVVFVWLLALTVGMWMAWARMGPFLRSANAADRHEPPAGPARPTIRNPRP
ncbi:hypothetical protein [Orf virus]|nr:hypothetical protein [Orf virus]